LPHLRDTNSPLSFYAYFETERKADVFMANLRTQIHFRAADEKGAKILSDKLGARKIREYSGGISSGKRSSNWQVTMKPWFKPAELQALGPGRATLKSSPKHRVHATTSTPLHQLHGERRSQQDTPAAVF